MKTLLTSLGIATALFLSGCGDNNGVETTNYLPKEINTEKITLLTNPKVDENETLQRYGHHTLQNHLEAVNETQKLLELNLLLAERLMKDIKSHCEGTGVGELCKIESDTFSLVLDDNLLNDMSQISGESPDAEDLAKRGKRIPFGAITYVAYDETVPYQYDLLINTTETEKFLGGESVDSAALIKWSQDKNQVFMVYSFNDDNLTNTLVLDHNKSREDSHQVVIENNVSNSEGETYNYCYLNLNDVNDSLNVLGVMHTNDGDFKLSSMMYVLGELAKDKPYLNYFGKVNEIAFEEHQRFDNNGSIISSKFCNAHLECDLSDESTWFMPEDKEMDELLYDLPTLTSTEIAIMSLPNLERAEDIKREIPEIPKELFGLSWNDIRSGNPMER